MPERFFAVAKLGQPHGLRGEVGLMVLTDFPERLRPPGRYILSPALPGADQLVLDSLRGSGRLYAHFEGFDTADAARDLSGRKLLVPADRAATLGEDTYWVDDLIGCRVVSDDGAALGDIEQVIETGANDVYMVRLSDGRSLPLPATKEVVKKVDIQARTVVVHLIPGLMDLAG